MHYIYLTHRKRLTFPQSNPQQRASCHHMTAGVSLSKEPLEKAEAAFEEQKISEECSEAAEENNTEA